MFLLLQYNRCFLLHLADFGKGREGLHLNSDYQILVGYRIVILCLMWSQAGSETECVSFDLRPSDAINIAVRCKVF